MKQGLITFMIENSISSQETFQVQDEIIEESEKVKITKKLVKFLIATGMFSFGFNFLTTAEYVHFRRIMEDIGITSATMVSVLFSISLVALCIGAVLGGFINDRIRSKFGQRAPSIFIGSISAALLFLIVPIVTQLINNRRIVFIVLLIVLVIAHLLLGGAYTPWLALVTDLFRRKERTLAGVIINIFSAAGAAIAIMIFSALIENNLSWLIWVITGVALAIGGIITCTLIPHINPENDENIKFRDIFRIPKILWKYGGVTWILLLVVNLFWGFGSHLVETGLVASLVKRFDVIETTASFASNILMGVYVVLFIVPIIWVVNKIGKIKAGIIASISYALFCLLLALMPNFNSIYFIVIVGGASNILLSTLQIALPADWVPKGREASFMGIFFVFSTIIKPIATLVQGVLLENKEDVSTLTVFGGYPWTFIFASISCVLALIVLITMLGRKQKKQILTPVQNLS